MEFFVVGNSVEVAVQSDGLRCFLEMVLFSNNED